jgi:hypothetical protein
MELTMLTPFDEEPSKMLLDSSSEVQTRMRIPDNSLCFAGSIETQSTLSTASGTSASSANTARLQITKVQK